MRYIFELTLITVSVVTMARLMLMYYVDFIAFMEAPDASWESPNLVADFTPPDGVQLSLALD